MSTGHIAELQEHVSEVEDAVEVLKSADATDAEKFNAYEYLNACCYRLAMCVKAAPHPIIYFDFGDYTTFEDFKPAWAFYAEAAE